MFENIILAFRMPWWDTINLHSSMPFLKLFLLYARQNDVICLELDAKESNGQKDKVTALTKNKYIIISANLRSS